MSADSEPLLHIAFAEDVIHWRGPSPFFFVPIPGDHTGEIRHAARTASYGWGVVPVEATIGDIPFSTSLFPREGGYLLPLKTTVRKRADIAMGDTVHVEMRIFARSPG